MKFFYITLAIAFLLYLFYYLSPVTYQQQTEKVWCSEEKKCDNFCVGVPIVSCHTGIGDACFKTCTGKCYGAVTSSCPVQVRKKMNPIEIVQVFFKEFKQAIGFGTSEAKL